jgi:pSer/pThr/pTyr-binding forkhead associated (FHA) protein
MQAVLVMFRSDGERRSFSIQRDMTVIGRREDCDLRIPLGEVSRKHCRLVRDGDILKVEDLGSSNGTFLNAHRVQEALLSPGDSIQVGPVVFVLQVDGTPADDELSPVSVPVAASDGDIEELGSGLETLDDSGPIEPTAGANAGEVEELEELEEAEELEEIGEEEDAVRQAAAGGTSADLDALDPLEPDLDEADEKRR